jgi:hypothetical protein
MVITNKDEKAWDFQMLMHTYLRVKVRSVLRDDAYIYIQDMSAWA